MCTSSLFETGIICEVSWRVEKREGTIFDEARNKRREKEYKAEDNIILISVFEGL